MLLREIEIQAFLDKVSPRSNESNLIRRRADSKARRDENQLGICAVLYGDPSFFERIGTFTARCGLFLQHPKRCNRNVPYRNPHCLPRAKGGILYCQNLEGLLYGSDERKIELSRNPIDLFRDAKEHDALPEAVSPEGLQTRLHRHQRQALTFMMERERGWALQGERADIWKAEKDIMGQIIYLNRVTGQKFRKPPRPFCGGLLTDAPGLGKTLSIIALLIQGSSAPASASEQAASMSATLLVVPKTRESRPVLILNSIPPADLGRSHSDLER